jgi:hypothetical protein
MLACSPDSLGRGRLAPLAPARDRACSRIAASTCWRTW